MLPNGMYNLLNLRHLHIRNTPLKEMPKAMGKLKQLHILSNFVVGKHKDNGIQELGGLLNLRGSFEITKLENVVDVRQARNARIIDKKHIDELGLKWCSGDHIVLNTQTERDVLNSLQPHNCLKELTIEGYKGTAFPDWVGRSCYHNMTCVSLVSCKNCCVLPSLGQLPSLKSLRIERFDQLKCIGDEFYKNEGDHHSQPIALFPSLERLEFKAMPCWEVWHLPDSEAFPQLKWLEIGFCQMLQGDMLNHVLMRIVSSLSDASKVHKLEIREDHRGWSRGMSLNGDSLSIKGCESVVEFSFKAVISNNHLSCLQEIHITECLSIVTFSSDSLPKSLQKLRITQCRKLEFPEQQHQKYDLVELQIENSCESLTSLSLDAFPNLKNLDLDTCPNLESISMSEPPHTALQRLRIFGCDKLVLFAGEGLNAPNLTHFQVRSCDKLGALPRDMNSLLPSLQSLDVRGCPNIASWPEGGLPPNLKKLKVGGCEQQLSSLSWMGNLDSLTHLTVFGFGLRCVSVNSYLELGSLPLLPSLTTLKISWFLNLETLKCNELLRLTSLQQLHISDCYMLENMAGEKLPPSLLLLQIKQNYLLGEKCKNKHQEIWHKISHIPTIVVDGKKIL
ncbi:putative disease resistance protein At3g14460 [Arachis duranensis]|uniref:Disease resistance protein At3g14460 n=1 Tax=Arachis duranensis TaxID=130453 RepID=A0A9C6WFH9_ARADU|nr:putative disease resistance protein At3g14460 [Arachis duranensis]